MTEKVEFSRDTLLMFAELLAGVQLPAQHPQLLTVAQQIVTGRAELEEALKQFPAVDTGTSP